MRYEYTITKEGGEAEIMNEMGWKKLFKKLLMKYPKFSGWCTYFNNNFLNNFFQLMACIISGSPFSSVSLVTVYSYRILFLLQIRTANIV